MALAGTVQLDQAEPGAAGGAGEESEFDDMSADGSKVFFTDTARLTADSDGGKELYMCEIVVRGEALTCVLKDLSVARNAGEAAAVLGTILGSDSSGRYVYFVANGRSPRMPLPATASLGAKAWRRALAACICTTRSPGRSSS